MRGKDRYRHVKSSQTSRKEDRPLIFSGTLGITTGGENQVEVAGRPGFVWVRLRNQLSETIQAFNEAVSPVFSLPVLVEYDKDTPTRYTVLGRDSGRYTVWVTTNAAGDTVPSTSPYLPAHGASHSFNKLTGVGGGDVVWVYGDQFIPWLVTPSGSSGALSVSIQPSAYYYDDQFRWAGGTGINGFDELYPTGSSNARMLLVYLDPDTGNPYLATGTLTEFANTITGTAEIMPYMPSLIEPTDIPLAGVRLITGSSVLLWQNLYDLRDYFAHSSVSGTSGGGGAPDDAQYVVMSLDGTLSDERVLTAGTDIDIADGGAGGNATVSVETGTFSRPGHAHFVINEIPIYEDGVFQATGTILDFTTNMDVAVTGTSVFISSTGGGGGGSTVLIYEDGAFQVTGSVINFESQLEVHVTGSTAHVKIPDNTFSEPGHTHFSAAITDLEHAIPIFEDSAFQVTGSAISFDDNLDVDVTGSVAYIRGVGATGSAGPAGDNTVIIYDDSSFNVTGSAISFDDNLTVHTTGSTAYIEGAAGSQGPPGDNTLLVYDDDVFQVTGTALDFGDNISVVVTGSIAYVNSTATDTFGYVAEGRLTVQSGEPIPTGSFSSATTIYYAPYVGDRLALYDGADWGLYSFTEKSLPLTGFSTGTPYDIFGFITGSSVGLEAVAWSNPTTRATAITRQNGIFVKSGTSTRRYLGTVHINNAGGQTDDTETKRFVWNYYNRVLRKMEINSTASHDYSGGAFRPWNNDTSLRLEIIVGVQEDSASVTIWGRISQTAGRLGNTSFGLDSTTVVYNIYALVGNTYTVDMSSSNVIVPISIGYHYLQIIERSETANTTTFNRIIIS
ncbi:MAG: hypothetical protein ACYS5F_14150 [Planctomycetota bacterium]